MRHAFLDHPVFDASTAPNPAFWTGSKAPLSINPEQTLGFRPGIVEGLIYDLGYVVAG